MNRLPKEPSPDGAPFEEGDGNGNSLKKVSLSGMVLVACPWVTDPAYNRSVFLIIEQNENGTIGVVLNKPMALDPKPLLNFLFKGESISEGSELGHFNFGGPNNGPILAIHSESALAEGGNSQGVYLSAQVDTLRQLAEHSPEHLRWIIGHANWEKSQLEQEIIDEIGRAHV